MEHNFQIVDILSDDITNNKKEKKFVITLYGINDKDERIICHILKYCPYYFIKIPNNWDSSQGEKLFKTIMKQSDRNKRDKNWSNNILKKSIKSYEIDVSKDFYGFYWDEKNNKQKLFNFLKINFNNLTDMKSTISEIKKFYNNEDNIIKYNQFKEWWEVEKTYLNDSNLYESDLHPIIRFIHDTGIDPTGWVQITENQKCKYDTNDGFENIAIETSCSYKNIKKIDNNNLSKYTIASFDIECDSSHGDFPLAKKDFKKLSTELFDSYRNLYFKILGSLKQNIKDNINEILILLISYSFDQNINIKKYEKYCDISLTYTINNCKPTNESIISCVKEIINNEKIIEFIYKEKNNSKDRDFCINKINNLLLFELCDINDNEIKVEGDPIIQIGTVFHKYGESKPCYKNILIIGPKDNMLNNEICDSLENIDIDVDCCSDEKELLLKWSELIKEQDPDFITGYNIFGFDFKYIKERVDYYFKCHHRCNNYNHHNDCEKRIFYNMGKISSDYKYKEHQSKICKFKEQKLNSSALGDNDLSYIIMDGRILFDIQKEVQKGHNLESYKLDNVAAHFMRGKLKDINDKFITVDTTGHLKNEDFISFRMHSNIGEELYQDGHKIKINLIDNKRIYLDEILDLKLENYDKIEWCLNKDDISPQDIFDKHKQIINGSKARAEIAKYCIQDCELCINLLLLLDIIPNNLAMANVSFVPASYIFLRGQGIKVTSVVNRKCSLKNTKIPDLKNKPKMGQYRKMFENGASDEEIKNKIIEDAGFRKPKDYELKEWLDEIKSSTFKIEGFEGAIVLEPKAGIYLDDPIAVLDYASLYPSSIIEKNLSHETLIEDLSLIDKIGIENLHIIKYDNYIYRGKGKGETIEKIIDENEPIKTCYYLKSEFMKSNNIDDMGIIPSVLVDLLGARKNTKKRMKNELDDFKKKVLDGLQLAYKVTSNSVYGQLGARTSKIFKMNIAACTTSIGRQRIEDASNGVKKWAFEKGYDEPDVVYGDSVLPDTPLILKHKLSNEILIKQIDELSNEYTDYHQFKSEDSNRKEKQQSLINDYEIYTSEGWSPIIRVIRHKTKKIIYRITTHTSVTDVTEDHSLLDERNNIIKPSEVSIGDKLLHNYIDFDYKNKIHLNDILYSIENIGSKSLCNKKAFIYGFFYGDGSCGKYDTKYGNKYTWALNQQNIETCSILQSLLIEIYDQDFNILDTLKSSGVYKIVPVKYIKKYVDEYRSLFYNKDKYKIIPQSILNGTYEERYSFFCGYYLADGSKCYNSKSKNIILTNKGKIGSSMLYYLAKSIGFKVSINSRKDKKNIFQITCSSQLRKDNNIIKKIEILKEINNEFVYDIETVQGNFNTGFECIVKNTDSVFVKFSRNKDGKILEDKEALQHCIQCGIEAGDYITKGKLLKDNKEFKHKPLLNYPQDLEYEKTFTPFILISKKRYTGDKYEFNINDYKRTSMGIVLKRRDNAPIVKYVFGNVIEKIMIDKDIHKTLEWLKTTLHKIKNGEFSLSYFIITKSLRGYYKNPQQIAHKVLADRMALRDPGNKPKSNDRIPYAYIQLNHDQLYDTKNPYKSGVRKGQPRLKNILQGDRIEHIDFIKKNNLKLDYEFYITNQIKNPVKQVLDLIINENESDLIFQ